MSPRKFFGFGIDQAERAVIDALVKGRNARSSSAFARTLIAEEAARQEVALPPGAFRVRQDKRRTKISAETRSQILERLDAGERTGAIAEDFDLPSQTVSKIKARACSTGNHHQTRHIS